MPYKNLIKMAISWSSNKFVKNGQPENSGEDNNKNKETKMAIYGVFKRDTANETTDLATAGTLLDSTASANPGVDYVIAILHEEGILPNPGVQHTILDADTVTGGADSVAVS